MRLNKMPGFYEFFAGGGMARAGLGPGWKCLFSNEIDPKKARAYIQNWGEQEISIKDVGLVSPKDLPRATADLAWASFPCQDLSLAGVGAGLQGARSGTFWPFWRVIECLNKECRPPTIIVLENVCGALTSHNGADFRSLIEALGTEGYRCGALIIDAALFLPHSRPRLFVIGVRATVEIDPRLLLNGPKEPFHNAALRTAHAALRTNEGKQWLWWNLPMPMRRNAVFSEIVEDDPAGVKWHGTADTTRLLGMMSTVNLAKIEKAGRMNRRVVGALYKRTRPNQEGMKVQRAEVRFDDIAGCLRTPNGGSSRQTIMLVQGASVRSRLLSPREAARLMGLPDDYELPGNYNEAYHLIGDGVAVPVVRHLAQHILEPLLANCRLAADTAA